MEPVTYAARMCMKEEPKWAGSSVYSVFQLELKAVPKPQDVASGTQHSPPRVEMVTIKHEPPPEGPQSDPSEDTDIDEVMVEVKLEPNSEPQETFVCQNTLLGVDSVKINQNLAPTVPTEMPSDNLSIFHTNYQYSIEFM